MKTTVRVLRGRHRGRTGWISGDLESRCARGITKAIVKLSDDVELLETANLEAVAQLGLFGDPQTETPPAMGQRRMFIPEVRYGRRLHTLDVAKHRDGAGSDRHQAAYPAQDLRRQPNDPFGLDQ